MRRSRSRLFFLYAVCLTAVLLLTGCISRSGRQEKLRDLEFIVLDQADVPRELGQMIEEEKAEPFRMTYTIRESFSSRRDTERSSRRDTVSR